MALISVRLSRLSADALPIVAHYVNLGLSFEPTLGPDGTPNISILRKTLETVTTSDLDDLIHAAARETGELEFKGALPFVPTKGQPAVADRWIEKGDRVGDYARDQVLAEMVAFANADGGTLVLGLHETKDEPRRAERLEALPKCEELAKRFLDATEDVIEPRRPSISVRGLVTSGDGSGYVLMPSWKVIGWPAQTCYDPRILRSPWRKSCENECWGDHSSNVGIGPNR